MACSWYWMLLLFIPSTLAQVTVQFLDTKLSVQEGEQFTLRLVKNGIISEDLVAVVAIEDDNAEDFVGDTQVATFTPGINVVPLTFTVRDDELAEEQEIFTFRLTVVGSNGQAVNPVTATVTIQASDDAYGVFSFLDPSPLAMVENVVTQVYNLRVGRDRGTFGRISLTYQVTGTSEEAQAGIDLTPTQGQVTFSPGQRENNIQLQVRSDNIPENEEKFIVRLISATSDATMRRKEIEVIINANDAPLRFEMAKYIFEEGPGTRTVSLNVFRGLDKDGVKTIGSTSSQVEAEIFFVGGTAKSGEDFVGQSTKLVFAPGVVRNNVTFEILDDVNPEEDETFEVQISGLKGDIVWGDPRTTVIIIAGNDNPNGIISFESVNNSASLSVQVNEDTFTQAVFHVVRGGGSFGAVAVFWEVVRDKTLSKDVLSDVGPQRGIITFAEGQTSANIGLTITQETDPEEAEKFIVRLLEENVTGNAKVEGIKEAELIIEDSDNVYGTVEFGPDDSNIHKIMNNPDSRSLRLQLSRNGGRLGSLIVNISVTFTDPEGLLTAEDMIVNTNIDAVMPADEDPVNVNLLMLPTAFLQRGGTFVATISDIRLQTEPTYGAYNSPSLGSRNQVSVVITAQDANGKIGFFNVSNEEVTEPTTGNLEISLPVSREGMSGNAQIRWTLKGVGQSQGFVDANDVKEMSGTIQIAQGTYMTELIITIKPDDIPETDEVMTVTLESVEPSGTQRLHSLARSINITILENDNPGGVFQFSPEMSPQYVVGEDERAIEVVVVRTGGSLMLKEVQYVIEPDTDKEFYGGINVLRFHPGEMRKTATVLARNDQVPELNETYTLRLLSYGNSQATIGNKSSILVTIKENNNPYGVLQFKENPMVVYMSETSGTDTQNASLTVERAWGLFGTVEVSWTLSPAVGDDLRPTFGTIRFLPDQKEANIVLESIDDNIAENDESFKVELSSATGGAILGKPSTATVIIRQNDNPVEFTENQVYAVEPSTLTFTVVRKGNVAQAATVRYRTLDGFASSITKDYVAVDEEIKFAAGQTSYSFNVTVLDDDEPEGNETFTLQLYDMGGDLLQTAKSTATVVIMDNDEAYGIFRFDSPLERNTEEGSVVYLNILREKGTSGSIRVFWRIRSVLSGEILKEKEQFAETSGSIIFQAQEGKRPLSVTPLADNTPEKNLAYKVELYKTEVVSGRNVEGLAKLADANTSVILNVMASDDPNGRFAFRASSRELHVAEDYSPGQEQTTRTTFIVERRQGIMGRTEVVWEIYSDSVGGNFPDVIDLMFLGNKPNTMSPVPSKQRNQTGTLVLMFSGAEGNFVTVPDEHKPNISNLEDGFTLSAWVQPFPETNGTIIAKTSADGVNHYYSLRVVTKSSATDINLIVSTSTKQNQVLTANSNQNINDGKWHHILVSISNISVVFYLDGKVVGNSKMIGEKLIDQPGPLLVGALPPGVGRFIGYMQDVRLFRKKLEPTEIKEVYEMPARKEVNPVSGILVFEENVKQNTFQVQSLQDIEEEGNEVFNVDLLSANGGASLSKTDASAILTVLKSDYANGLFEYEDLCTPTTTKQENVTITCSVRRTRGDDGSVTLTWLVQQVSPTPVRDAIEDFVNYTGRVVFPPGNRLQPIQFEVKEENIPELEERFSVLLYKVESDDGVVGTTNTSGASINPDRSSSPIIIEETDYPYGLLQFSTSLTPPADNSNMILPSTSPPQVKIKEESGVVSLIVERAQGTLGRVSAEWKTEDITAKSEGKTPTDYVAKAGVVVFENGVQWAYVNITINDNAIPEDEKSFRVQLVNPQNGAAVGLGAVLTVVIASSDGAFGIYRFADSSLAVTAKEEGDLGYNSVFLEVVREGGTIGNANVSWVAVGDDANDLMEKSGLVIFTPGQSTSKLEVKIRGDAEPELDEIFRINLTGTTEGELGNVVKLNSMITIEANDDPYGQFIINSTYRPITVEEKNTDVTIGITRLKGKFGSVRVNFATLSQTETHSFLPGPLLRAADTDFRPLSGFVQFLPNQQYADFKVTIFDDSIPEEDESLFVRLTSATVTQQAQVAKIDNSPTLGLNSTTYAQILISSNDNANGILQLSTVMVTVEEGSTPNLWINRSGGLFGEVTVEFKAVDGTARSKIDYDVLQNEVIMSSGQTSKQLPIEIIDDRLPEKQESLTVELVKVKSGGAVLGVNKTATINIAPSDDPNGVFEFVSTSRTVEEPENSQPYMVAITVQRLGGSDGIVRLGWNATINGDLATDDVIPASGALLFLSNDASNKIIINVKPDDIPEGREDIEINLVVEDGDGRVGPKGSYNLSITPNDNPHGFVQLFSNEYSVEEKIGQTIRLQRSGGNYGSLRVFYTVGEIDLVEEITKQGQSVSSYYSGGTSGKRSDNGNTVDISSSTMDPLLACMSVCIGVEACVSIQFARVDNSPVCQWFTTATSATITDDSFMIYDKNSEKFKAVEDSQAKLGEDFEAMVEDSVIIKNGETSGLITLKLMDDTLPELDEKFNLRLTRVEVAEARYETTEAPVLGATKAATVIIKANDNANGMFNIYGSPVTLGRNIQVEEKERLAVDLIVERQGGTIGNVSVQWVVEAKNATYGQDFIADGAILVFSPGQTRRVITVTILDDQVPEDKEMFTIRLTNPQGGGVLGQDTNITVTILENDHVAGLVGFETTSLLASEGDTLNITVKRTAPAYGRVALDWVIQGRAGLLPEKGFKVYSGSLTFLPGEITKQIMLEVLVDTTPEVNEEYDVNLINLNTTGVGVTGSAAVDPQAKTLLISIRGSNNPHGVIQFSQTSQRIRVEENVNTMSIAVDRKFGAIGKVRVSYTIKAGSLTPLSSTLEAATLTDDFQGGSVFVDMDNGISTASISVNIVNDSKPEIDEVFLVNLTSVNLIGSTSNTNLPHLAANGTVSEVIINANDGSKGVIVFASSSRIVPVDERSINITLSVVRQQGKFGDVSVFCFAQSIQEGSTLGVDFNFTPQEIVFKANEDTKNIAVQILNDDLPEPDEQFEVILSNPKNMVEIGKENKATVTILANDEPSGTINFTTTNEIFLTETSPSNSKTELRLIRGPGIYGAVNLPYKVLTAGGGEATADLTPSSGVITFKDRQTTAVLEIAVIDDDIPEPEERFVVQLLTPSNDAKLGTNKEVTIVVRASDSPQGLFEIFLSNSGASSLSVEENNQGFLSFDIKRSRGMKGRVMVDVVTEQQTALTMADPKHVTLGHFQTLMGRNVTNWHSYVVNGTTYILMLTSLTADQDIRPDIPEAQAFGAGQSILWRWQGEIKLLQTLQTNDATAATHFEINGVTYVVVANSGKEGARETMSALYIVTNNGNLQWRQGFSTKGATDVEYFTFNNNRMLVFTNALDNGSRSTLTADVYVWDNVNQQFNSNPTQSISTMYATSCEAEEIDGNLVLFLANYYDSERNSHEISSIIMKISSDLRFAELQRITTLGAVDSEFVTVGMTRLLVIANNRQTTVSSPQASVVYRWDSSSQTFLFHQQIYTRRVQKVSSFTDTDGTVFIAFANDIGNSEILMWNISTSLFTSVWTGKASKDLYPIIIKQMSSSLILLASAPVIEQNSATVYQAARITKTSDFIPRTTTLIFEENQTLLRATAVVLQDDIPENTETFAVKLTNPVGGAEIGSNSSVVISILSNDNAHGIIEFSNDSLLMRVSERPDEDTVIQLNVVRKQGFFGHVVILWSTRGDHDGPSDIAPTSGLVEFANGQTVATISITVRDDSMSELDERTYVMLEKVNKSGTNLPSRGAQIGVNNEAQLIVMANDSPHGVVSWEILEKTVSEPEGTDAEVALTIIREQGTMSEIRVTFVTSAALSLPARSQATSGEDFVSRQGDVYMKEGVTRATVTVTVKQDNVPEADEVFYVNITSAELVGNNGNTGSKPSIKVPENMMKIIITENDNARGVIDFNVTTNIEGRVDTYEEFGRNHTLELDLKRMVGSVGSNTVTWQVDHIETNVEDIYPTSGTVVFQDGQTKATIEIVILDDSIAETKELFTVKLISVKGGALIGPINQITVAILANDSPTGYFMFNSKQVTTKESTTSTDPNGQATLVIRRIQGSEGLVTVQWRLNAEAKDDFLPPLGGTVQFSQGEVEKTIVLQTKPDNILEGQEKFIVSLVKADNNAIISSTQGDADVIIMPDTGASGTISILPDYRTVYIGEAGESSPSYNGKTEVKLTRGEGIFGEVTVTWTITPRDQQAFLQLEGSVRFVDLQQQASIILQSKDDTIAEMKRIYTLQINSAAGGAVISSEPSASTSAVWYVASDYPHGVFEFELPQITRVEEDNPSVSVPVMRKNGVEGRVQISYITSSGTAKENEDFFPASGTLLFEQDAKRQNINVDIKPDTIPEGPEIFYVNITSVQLLQPSDNDYTIRSGLTLDMKPIIGSVNLKSIIIEKNDNAEGTIEFHSNATSFTVKEETGVARIPVTRSGGNYGRVSALYRTQNLTAQIDLDYLASTGEVYFDDGVNTNTINITIRDDSIMEFEESFKVFLTGSKGGAILGTRRESTVTIAKSDYPNGKFGFVGQGEIIMVNPETMKQLTFVIERTNGLLGQQKVYWRILGPNNPNMVLQDTTDISLDINNVESTNGELVWLDGENGEKQFVLDVKPYSSWEIEKRFIIEIYRIIGTPVTVGNGEKSPDKGHFNLTILKFGDPNGVIRFDSAAQVEREIEEPGGSEVLKLSFPVVRKIGTGIVGAIKINWIIEGPPGLSSDVQPTNGSLLLSDEQRSSAITLDILPDDLPELTETFNIKLVSVEGGAEIDTEFVTSTFRIRYNDNPHGIFGVLSENQAIIVDPADLMRRIQLNFTRYAGTFGSCVLTFALNYDTVQAGVTLSENTGTVTFTEGMASAIKLVDIEGNGFLELGTTFTVSLQQVLYIGSGVTQPPSLKPGETEAKITVPEIAANTKIGFMDTVVSVDDVTYMAVLNLTREGTYGSLRIDWEAGTGGTNDGTVNGLIVPSFDSVSIPHGEKYKSISVQAIAKRGVRESFMVRLPQPPVQDVNGGGQLMAGRTEAKIEPSGLIRFSTNSTNPTISELEGKVTLQIERLYGSEGKLQITYQTEENTAKQDIDFTNIQDRSITMETGQISVVFDVIIIQDNQPEREENFNVRLMDVIRFPTSTEKRISPRLNESSSVSVITIKESNDPYGVLSIQPASVSHRETYTNLTFNVVRSGGLYGTVSVKVRTVGGEEEWTKYIVPRPGNQNNTIADILGNRNSLTAAEGGRDYQVLDETLTFLPNEQQKEFKVSILDDSQAEAAETVLLYLTEPGGGATIAKGEPDGGRKGFSVITIEASDLSNGIIGFSEQSKAVFADEDKNPMVQLELYRLNAFGRVTVSWKAKVSANSDDAEDATLSKQLQTTAGTAVCALDARNCPFTVPLIDDNDPEAAFSFIVVLTGVGEDAELNNASRTAVVNVAQSDYFEGLVQFRADSRIVIVSEEETSVKLEVERAQGQGFLVQVDYQTMQLTKSVNVAGIEVSAALEGSDFSKQTGTLQFLANTQEVGVINLKLTPVLASDNPLPKQFNVILGDPTNGAKKHENYSVAVIRIVKPDEVLAWQAISNQQITPLNNTNIMILLARLDNVVKDDMSDDEMNLVEDSLKQVVEKGNSEKLPDQVNQNMKNIFCKLLDTDKNDVRRGRHSLTKILEDFAYTLVTGSKCSTPGLVSYECNNVKVSAGRWTSDQLKGYSYEAQRDDEFKLPDTLPGDNSQSDQCKDFHIIEYNSDQWFKTEANVELLNDRIVSFGIKGQASQSTDSPVTFRIHTKDRRIAAERAQCVYFDEGSMKWTGSSGVCEVTNNLQLATYNYVDCSCKHMTSYTVIGKVYGEGIVGYTIWFYIACFICIACLTLVILSHHLCSVHPMFPASLLMHMFFAALASQCCIVVAAYFSPTSILVPNLEENNYKCIVMGIFMHYFFLCQFSWIMTQAFNFWKILVLNDEHSNRNYMLFFLSGWGLPMLLIAIFYAITYNLYKYVYNLPYDFIYGDVNLNGEICFITNAYAATGGILVPILLMLLVVVVVFLRAFQLAPQWQPYDDIYRGRYNRTEVQIIIGLYIVIVLTWLWAGLHMVYGQLWMLILFCIFDIIQGLMALVLYGVLRNPCIPCCDQRKTSGYHSSSHFNGWPQEVEHNYSSFRRNHYTTPPVRDSKDSLLNQSWEKESVGHKSQMTVKRALPTQVYINPPVSVISPASHRTPHHRNSDDKDFEDLLYALKTGGSITPSEMSRSIPSDNSSELSVKLDNFETKRINIADTHL